ncbi:MAG: hypothetical protein AAB459_03015 [Patescibacteria group bacterium]
MYKFIWKIQIDRKFTEQEFINFWRETSTILQKYKGAAGTIIHKVEGEERTYMAIASWQTKADRDAMQADTDSGDSELAKRWQKYPKNSEWGKTEFIGRIEEIDNVKPENIRKFWKK